MSKQEIFWPQRIDEYNSSKNRRGATIYGEINSMKIVRRLYYVDNEIDNKTILGNLVVIDKLAEDIPETGALKKFTSINNYPPNIPLWPSLKNPQLFKHSDHTKIRLNLPLDLGHQLLQNVVPKNGLDAARALVLFVLGMRGLCQAAANKVWHRAVTHNVILYALTNTPTVGSVIIAGWYSASTERMGQIDPNNSFAPLDYDTTEYPLIESSIRQMAHTALEAYTGTWGPLKNVPDLRSPEDREIIQWLWKIYYTRDWVKEYNLDKLYDEEKGWLDEDWFKTIYANEPLLVNLVFKRWFLNSNKPLDENQYNSRGAIVYHIKELDSTDFPDAIENSYFTNRIREYYSKTLTTTKQAIKREFNFKLPSAIPKSKRPRVTEPVTTSDEFDFSFTSPSAIKTEAKTDITSPV